MRTHPSLLPSICLVKVNTEGHDTAILADLATVDWRSRYLYTALYTTQYLYTVPV